MSRILVTGALGMVGREVCETAGALGWEVAGRSHAELDITDQPGMRVAMAAAQPDVVLNAAAYTQVDTAESEPELAWRANAHGPGCLAEACAASGVPLIHISTDYVFDGQASRPYLPDDQPHPLGVYGRTKWEGEQAVRKHLGHHLIVRTSWVYASHGHNFLRTVVDLARERETLRVVADQRGSPTFAGDLAHALLTAATAALDGSARWGTYHFANAGDATWYEFATAIMDGLAGRAGFARRSVVPITSADYPTSAARPAYSVLDTSAWTTMFGISPRPWRDALSDALYQMT